MNQNNNNKRKGFILKYVDNFNYYVCIFILIKA